PSRLTKRRNRFLTPSPMSADSSRETSRAALQSSATNSPTGTRTSTIPGSGSLKWSPTRRSSGWCWIPILSFPEDKTEWNGTKVIFEIARKGNKTEVRFTHEGLVPDYQCFDKCSSAWGFYINGSLKSLITTGKGDANKRER